jgi:hypothetical protein
MDVKLVLSSLFLAYIPLGAQTTTSYNIQANTICRSASIMECNIRVGDSFIRHAIRVKPLSTPEKMTVFSESSRSIDPCDTDSIQLTESLDGESGYTKFTITCSGVDNHKVPFKMVARIWAKQREITYECRRTVFDWDGRLEPQTCTRKEWVIVNSPIDKTPSADPLPSNVEITK